MRSIDERIIDMQFNNKQFEDGISTSMKSLDNLKKGLEDTGKDTSLNAIQIGIETISEKFSSLGVIGLNVLQNLTNRATDLALELGKSLTIDPIMAGFTKYEQKTSAVQTILNSTGMGMDEVNEQLEKLNWFTDETSYNFIDMVSSIGKFTSAGVELDVAVTAMQGIANWAALSGQDANGASRAMYNLAQSIGMGAVKLQDWKSIENANMATKEFKEIAIETAQALGVLSNDTDVTYANFSSTLQKGWFTSEVLLATLDKYGNYTNEIFKVATGQGISCAEAIALVSSETMELGAKAFKAAQEAKTFTDAINATKDAVSTGWMTTFEIIFGDYYEAKELWTDIANHLWDVFASGAEARNDMLQAWKDLGGRDDLIQIFWNLTEAIQALIDPVKSAFSDIFPPATAEKLFGITESLKSLTERLKISEETSDKLRHTFKGIFAFIDVAKEFFGAIFKGVGDALSTLLPLGDGILDITAGFGDFIVGIRDAAIESESFQKVTGKISTVLKMIFEIIRKVVTEIKSFATNVYEAAKESETLHNVVYGIFEFLLKAKDFFIDVAVGVRDFTASLWEAGQESGFFSTFVEKIKTILENLHDFLFRTGEGIKTAVDKIGEHFQGFDGINLNPLELFSGAVDAALHPFRTVGNIFKKAWEIIVDVIAWVTPYVQKAASVIGPAIRGLFGAFGEAFRNGDFKKFLELVNTGLLGVVILRIKGFIEGLKDVSGNASGALKGVTDVLDGVRGCFEAYQTKLKAQTLLTIAIAVGILAASLWVLSGIPGDRMLVAIGGLTVLVAELAAAMLVMGKSFKTIKGGVEILMFATAVFILAAALKTLSSLSWDDLQKGTTGITILITELTAASMILSKSSGRLVKGGIGLIAFSAAILILAQAAKSLSTLDPAELAAGLIGIGVIMAEVAGFTQIVKPEKLLSTGIAMIAMGAAIKIMSGAVIFLGGADIDVLAKGIIGLGIVLAEVAGFTQIVKPEKLTRVGIAMIAMGAALKIMSGVVKTFGEMELGNLTQGLIGMGIALAEIAGFTQIVKPEKMMSSGIAMIAVGAALLIIAQAVKSFGGMSWEDMAKGLIALGGALLIITLTMNAMQGTVGAAAAMLILAASLNLMIPAFLAFGNMSWEEIGKSLLMLASIFVIFGAAAAILSPLIPVMLGLAGALALLGVGVLAIGVGMVALSAGLTAFALGGPAFITGLTVMLEAIIMSIPIAMAALVEGLILMIEALSNGIAVVIESLVVILKAVIEGLIVLIPDVVEAVFIFLTAMADALIEFIPKLIELGMTLLLSLLHGIADNIQEVIATALLIISEFLRGIAFGIPGIIEAAVDIISVFLASIGEQTPKIIDAAFKMIIDFINGLADAIRENTGTLVESMINLANALIEGLIDGIFAGVRGVVDAIVTVAKSLWEGFRKFFGIKSPSTLMEAEGENVSKGLQEGIKNGENGAVTTIKNLGNAMMDGIRGALSGVGNVASNVVSGLSNGIKSGISTVSETAKNLGSSLLNGVKGVLGIESPSRRMIEVGEYTGQGLVIGLEAMEDRVVNSAGTVGDSAAVSMKKSLDKVSDALSGDFDLAPTIRPVVDMTDVKSGLDSTFNKQQLLNVGEVKGRVGAVVAVRQNGINTQGGGGAPYADNSEQKFDITVHNYVRNDSDIQKINRALDNIITKHKRTKGVPVNVPT